jgi:hypothetical protein
MQIMQFIGGASLAAIYLFISYTVPVSVPYESVETISKAATTTAGPLAASLTSPVALSTATGAAVAFLKKLVYRAAGEEGLAENIPGAGSVAHPLHPYNEQQQHPLHETVKKVHYRTEYQAVPCVDTSGQAFAIYINLFYLLPLTILFARFFVKSYLRRTSPNTKHQTKKNAITKSGVDAYRGVKHEVERSLGRAPEDGEATTAGADSRGRAERQDLADRIASLSPDNQKFVESVNRKVSQKLEEIGEGSSASLERAKQLAKEIVSKATKSSSDRVELTDEVNGDVIKEVQANGKKSKDNRNDEVNGDVEKEIEANSKKSKKDNKNDEVNGDVEKEIEVNGKKSKKVKNEEANLEPAPAPPRLDNPDKSFAEAAVEPPNGKA